MRSMSIVVLSSLAAAAEVHAGGAPTHYFDLINAAHDSVASLATAPAGSGAFREIEIGESLRGGFTSAKVEIAGAGCLHDFRVVFRGGRTLLYPAIDVCRYRGLRLSARDGRSAPGRGVDAVSTRMDE